MVDGIRTGRTDCALVRLATRIMPNEADGRLMDVLTGIQDPLPMFIPTE